MAKSSKAARLEYNDKLITAVQMRGIIWDCGRQDYKDQRKKAVAWAEIIADIGTDPGGKFTMLVLMKTNLYAQVITR